MRLETHEGMFADPATPEAVALAVAELTAVGEAYVIMSIAPDDETYVQAAGTVSENFIVALVLNRPVPLNRRSLPLN